MKTLLKIIFIVGTLFLIFYGSYKAVKMTGSEEDMIFYDDEINTEITSVGFFAKKVYKTAVKGNRRFTFENAVYLTEIILEKADEYNIPPRQAFLIVDVESNFKTRAYNRRGEAYGLCQITPVCLEEYNRKNYKNFTETEMFEPRKNLEVGFWFVRYLFEKYPEDIKNWDDLYIAYNVGANYFIRNKDNLYKGIYKNGSYGSFKRYERLSKYWLRRDFFYPYDAFKITEEE